MKNKAEPKEEIIMSEDEDEGKTRPPKYYRSYFKKRTIVVNENITFKTWYSMFNLNVVTVFFGDYKVYVFRPKNVKRVSGIIFEIVSQKEFWQLFNNLNTIKEVKRLYRQANESTNNFNSLINVDDERSFFTHSIVLNEQKFALMSKKNKYLFQLAEHVLEFAHDDHKPLQHVKKIKEFLNSIIIEFDARKEKNNKIY